MRILIIGGSRFVGPLAVELLLKQRHEISVFNRGRISQTYHDGVHFIKGDRNRGFQLRERFDAVIDMCAYNGKQTSQAIQELKFDFFVHFSTAAVYKKSEVFPLIEDSLIGEWALWGGYNRGKVECEKVLFESEIRYSSIRPVYILGPKNYADRERFLYSKLKHGEQIILPGNGQALIQFVFAKEVARAIAYIAENQIEGAFNAAGDEAITLKGLIEEMARICGHGPIIKYNTAADGTNFNEREFPFANESLIAGNAKIKSLGINFKPLVQGLREDYENYYKKII